MPFLTDSKKRLFREVTPKNEPGFEKMIVNLADSIFGEESIFITKKRLQKGGGIAGIPDGYLLDFVDPAKPRLFVVEVELQTHDLFKHITEQLVRFAAGFENNQRDVRIFLHSEIQNSKQHRRRLEAAQKVSNFPNIDALLDKAVFAPFQGLVIIDKRDEQLARVLKQFACIINAIEVKSWIAEDGTELHQFETLYDEDENSLPDAAREKRSYSPQQLASMRERRAQCDTVVVPARAEGFKETFLGENRWYEIRVSAGMLERIKFIAAYQLKPISAVTHLAEVKEIRPCGTNGKFEVIFSGPAKAIKKVRLKNSKNAPYGPVYVRRADLLKAKFLEGALKAA